MARQTGSNNFAGTLEVLAGGPLDARTSVKTKADLTASGSFPYPYIGMQTFVESEKKRYTLIAADPTDLESWRSDGSSIDMTVYQPGGSVAFASLPTLGADVLGFVYNVTDAFTTTADFVEGAGIDYPAGSNVAVINAGTDAVPVYKFDVLSGMLSGYQTKMQFAVLPTAASTLEGAIYQYVGATTQDLINGYYYKCVEDPENTGSYIWVAHNVQEIGSTGELEESITAAIDVGGIDAGTTFAAGTSYDDVLDALLNPTLYPTLTAPSASISGTGDKLLEMGSSLEATITVVLNRGSITPAYGTNGYRSGEATGYSLNSGVAQAQNTFTETVTNSNKTFTGTVTYGAGEQPKDSKGGNYDSPLAAGSLTTSTLSYEFVNALYANTSSASTISKQALVSKSAKVKAFSFPATTAANPEVFDVPASWTVTTVEVLNSLSNQWETATSQFTVTDTTHDDAGGSSTAYKRYTCNLGYDMGARQVRFKWS